MSVKFINHSCIQVEGTLIDPWFSGKIFNNSWDLLQETDFDKIDYDSINQIIISHEHPDHLNFPTLKEISKRLGRKIPIIYRDRQKDILSGPLTKMGYDIKPITPGYTRAMGNQHITFIPEGHDNVVIVNTEEGLIVHQNDCYLSVDKARMIKKACPDIKAWFMQFSLAGHYDDIEKGRQYHLDIFKKYQDIFKPEVSVPFASFVYFCRPENKYLNDHAVSLHDVRSISDYSFRVMAPFESLSDEENTDENIRNWTELFTKEREYIPATTNASIYDVVKKANKFLEGRPRLNMKIYLSVDDEIFIVDFKVGKCSICEYTFNSVAAKLKLADLDFMFSFPWGPDTVNITACFEKYTEDWNTLLLTLDSYYERH